jgi:hypothetical protein
MSSPSGGTNRAALLAPWNDKIDVPMWFSVNSEEYAALDKNQNPYRIRQVHLQNLNNMFNLNGIAIPPLNATPWTTNDFVTYPRYGFPLPEQKTIATKYGFPITEGTFRNAYGIPLMQLALVQGLEHTHYMPLAGVAWDFLSKYSRDPVTKELHIQTDTPVGGSVGGTVPATLSLSLGTAAPFAAFQPGADRTYTTSTTATVTSTAGDATLTTDGGRLSNGAFTLSEPLAVTFSKSTWSGPVSNDAVTIGFQQHIGANEPLRTGTYSKTLTFTLSTTTP